MPLLTFSPGCSRRNRSAISRGETGGGGGEQEGPVVLGPGVAEGEGDERGEERSR